jgi:D-glycero-D-manno-heptose 1,7-bisphosphate phosphatase
LYSVDPQQSWMVGDNDRDLVPARKLGIHTIGIGDPEKFPSADACVGSLLEAVTSVVMK